MGRFCTGRITKEYTIKSTVTSQWAGRIWSGGLCKGRSCTFSLLFWVQWLDTHLSDHRLWGLCYLFPPFKKTLIPLSPCLSFYTIYFKKQQLLLLLHFHTHSRFNIFLQILRQYNTASVNYFLRQKPYDDHKHFSKKVLFNWFSLNSGYCRYCNRVCYHSSKVSLARFPKASILKKVNFFQDCNISRIQILLAKREAE